MNFRFLALISVIYLCHVAIPAYNQAVWKQYNGPFSGDIESLTSYGDTLFVCSRLTGIFKSSDSGLNWKPAVPSLTLVNSVFDNDTSLLIGGAEPPYSYKDRVYSYKGSNHDLIPISQQVPGQINYFHKMEGELFVSTHESVYKYDPESRLLIEKNNGLPPPDPIRWTGDLVSIDGVLFCNVLNKGLYKSFDKGEHWEKVVSESPNLPNGSYYSLKTRNDSLLYVHVHNVFLSADKGQSWKTINYNLPTATGVFRDIAILGNKLFVTSSKGIFSITEGSTNWEKVDDLLFSRIMTDEDLMFSTDVGSVNKWDDVSKKFIPSNKGMNTSTVNDIEVFNHRLYSGTLSGLHFTTPGSDNWKEVSELRGLHVSTIKRSKSQLFVGTSKGLYVASASSNPVFSLLTGLPAIYISDIEVLNDRIFAATQYDVYVSYDEGKTWKALPNSVAKAPDAYIQYLAADNNMLVAGNTKGLCKILSDSSDWKKIGFFTTQTSSLNIINGIIYAGEMNSSIYRSLDGGATWGHSHIAGYNRLDMIKRGNNIYAATYNKIYYSDNNGESWDSYYETGIPAIFLNCIAEGENDFYVGTTGKSVWHRPYQSKKNINTDVYTIVNDTIYDVNPLVTPKEFQKNVSVSYGASIEMEIISDSSPSDYAGLNRVKILAEDGINKQILNVSGAPGVPCDSTVNNSSFTTHEKTVSFYIDADTWSTNSFYWEFGDGATSTEQNPVHTFPDYAEYTVTLQVSNECGLMNSYHDVDLACPAVVNPSIEYTAENTTITFKNSGTLSPLLSSTYAWSFGDGTTSTERNPIHTYAAPGTYEVELQEINECSEKTVVSSVVVLCPHPEANFDYEVDDIGLQVTFANLSSNYTSVIWSIEGTELTDESPSFTFAPGTHEVCLDAVNTCGTKTVCKNVSVVITGTETDLDNSILLYPNPSTEYLLIQSLQERIDHVEIITIAGKPVYSEGFNTPKSEITINTEAWNPGEYILTLTMGSTKRTRKIVKR
jgi:PKD repeat protein